MKFKILVLLCVIWLTNLESWGELKVVSIAENSADLSASRYERLDLNNQPCALIKVWSPEKVLQAQGDVVGDIMEKDSETWIYVINGTRMLKLIFESQPPVFVDFNLFGVNSADALHTYELKLENPLGMQGYFVRDAIFSYFDWNDGEIFDRDKKILLAGLANFSKYFDRPLIIEPHISTYAGNLSHLEEKCKLRAAKAKEYLIELGVNPDNIAMEMDNIRSLPFFAPGEITACILIYTP